MSAENFLRFAHSPDADDRFFLWPLTEGIIASPEIHFSFIEADTATLNTFADENRVEVCALSAIHYARVHTDWQPLLYGASFGDGYGPVVVTKTHHQILPEETPQWTLLCPGQSTTAYSVLKWLGFSFGCVETIPISPMEAIFERLKDLPETTAALVIHEGRLTYPSYGFVKALDIGEGWQQKFGGTLPLGINAISRKLPETTRKTVAALIKESCLYAIAHREVFVEKERTRTKQAVLDDQKLRAYLDLYANPQGAVLGSADREAFAKLISLWAKENGHKGISIDWL